MKIEGYNIDELAQLINDLLERNNKLEQENKELKETKEHLLDTLDKMEAALKDLTQQVNTRNRKIYGRTTEKVSQSEKRAETGRSDKEHKPKSTYEEQFKNLEVEEKTILVEESELEGYKTTETIGRQFVRYEVIYIKAQFKLRKVYVETKKCVEEGKEDEPVIITAQAPKPFIEGSYATPELVSKIMFDKYHSALPIERQEKAMIAQGVDSISKSTMTNWLIMVAEDYLFFIYHMLLTVLITMKNLQDDDTVIKVHKEADRSNTCQSRMWVATTTKYEPHQIAFYQYTETKEGGNVSDLLTGFSGYLLVDGYKGYNSVKNATLALCWAHPRRYFNDIVEALPKAIRKDSQAYVGFTYINLLYTIEHSFDDEIDNPTWTREQRADKRVEYRQQYSTIVLESLKRWLDGDGQLTTGKTKKVVDYCLDYWSGLCTFLQNGEIELDNNRSERLIKPVVMGRKNWLFFDSPRGACSGAIAYTIIETAKANKLNPYEYIKHLLITLSANEITDELLESLLPWSKDIPDVCKQKSNK